MAKAEMKRVTLHPLLEDGSMDTSVNLYPKTLINGIVDDKGNPVKVITEADLDNIKSEITAEETRALEAENQLQANIEEESNRAKSAEYDLQEALVSRVDDLQGQIDEKQDIIKDLDTIRDGATLGAVAVQPEDLAAVATTGDYNDLSNKPVIPVASVADVQVNGNTVVNEEAIADIRLKTINNESITGEGDIEIITDAYTKAEADEKFATNTALAAKADDNSVVHLSGDEIISGAKTFVGDNAIKIMSSGSNSFSVHNGDNYISISAEDGDGVVFEQFYNNNWGRYYLPRDKSGTIALASDISDMQATSVVVGDAITNINGREFQHYTAELITTPIYTFYQILKDGNSPTEDEAKEYMKYMTGYTFLPRYNYDFPKQTIFTFKDRSTWKPQYSINDGLRLYKLTSPVALESDLVSKQDTIEDLADIRAGADLGATAVQPDAISDMATETWVGEQGYITNSYHDNTKQNILVSGTNIKTINNESLLGSGNIAISGGYDIYDYDDTAETAERIYNDQPAAIKVSQPDTDLEVYLHKVEFRDNVHYYSGSTFNENLGGWVTVVLKVIFDGNETYSSETSYYHSYSEIDFGQTGGEEEVYLQQPTILHFSGDGESVFLQKTDFQNGELFYRAPVHSDELGGDVIYEMKFFTYEDEETGETAYDYDTRIIPIGGQPAAESDLTIMTDPTDMATIVHAYATGDSAGFKENHKYGLSGDAFVDFFTDSLNSEDLYWLMRGRSYENRLIMFNGEKLKLDKSVTDTYRLHNSDDSVQITLVRAEEDTVTVSISDQFAYLEIIFFHYEGE